MRNLDLMQPDPTDVQIETVRESMREGWYNCIRNRSSLCIVGAGYALGVFTMTPAKAELGEVLRLNPFECRLYSATGQEIANCIMDKTDVNF